MFSWVTDILIHTEDAGELPESILTPDLWDLACQQLCGIPILYQVKLQSYGQQQQAVGERRERQKMLTTD